MAKTPHMATLDAHPAARALIFDMDGTLIDSLEVNWRAMDAALRQHNIKIDRNEFVGMTGRSLEEIVSLLVAKYGGRPEDCQAIVDEKRRIANSHINNVVPFEVVADVARRNRGRLPMCVGTGSDRHRAVKMLEATGLLPLFDHIVAAEDVCRHKPHPETFLRCAELMHIAPQDCQVFEDGDTGIEAARAAGMMVCDVRGYIEG